MLLISKSFIFNFVVLFAIMVIIIILFDALGGRNKDKDRDKRTIADRIIPLLALLGAGALLIYLISLVF